MCEETRGVLQNQKLTQIRPKTTKTQNQNRVMSITSTKNLLKAPHASVDLVHLHLVTSCVYSDPISIWCVETLTFTPGHVMRLLWSDIYLMCWNIYIYTWSRHAFTLIRYLSDVLKHLHLHLVTSCVYSDPISIWCVETLTLHLVTSCVYSDPISIWCVETLTFTPGHVMRLLWSDIYLMCWNTYIYTWSRHAFTLIRYLSDVLKHLHLHLVTSCVTLIRYLSDVLKHLHLHLVTSCVYSDPISIWCVETLTFTPGHVMRLLWSDIYLMCWNIYIYTWSLHAFTLIRYLSDVLKHLHLHLVTSCVYSDPISIWCVENTYIYTWSRHALLWSDIYLMCWNTYIYTWSRHAFTLIRYLSDVLKHLHLHLVTSCVYSDPISIWCVETLTFTPGHVMRLLWSDIYLMCWNTYIYTWSRHAFTLIRYLSDVLKHLHLHLVTSCVYSDPISIWCVETLTFTPGHVMRLLWSDIYLMCWNTYIYTWSRHAFTLIRYLSDVLKHLHLHLVTSCVYSDPISIWCVETLTFTPGHVMRLLWSDIYLMCWNTYIYTWSRHAFTLIRYLSDVLKHLHLHLVTSCVYSDPISIWCVETFPLTPDHINVFAKLIEIRSSVPVPYLNSHRRNQKISVAFYSDLISFKSTSKPLRSANKGLLYVPRSRLQFKGDRAFAVAAPPDIKSAPSISVFKSRLKTHLYSMAFPEF